MFHISREEVDNLSEIFYNAGSTLNNQVELKRAREGKLIFRWRTGKIWYFVLRPRSIFKRAA